MMCLPASVFLQIGESDPVSGVCARGEPGVNRNVGFQIHGHGLEFVDAVNFVTISFGDRVIFRTISTKSQTGRFCFKSDLLELVEIKGIPNLWTFRLNESENLFSLQSHRNTYGSPPMNSHVSYGQFILFVGTMVSRNCPIRMVLALFHCRLSHVCYGLTVSHGLRYRLQQWQATSVMVSFFDCR